jgi:hypothetical protein
MRRLTVNPGDPDRPLLRRNEDFGLRTLRARDWLLLASFVVVGLGLLVLLVVLSH